MSKHRGLCGRVVGGLALAWLGAARADVCNLKIVTDGNPDYSDIGSLLYSATSNWDADRDKAWALFYWNHIARRQTNPMELHGVALADPIRQFNDYGYTMCSTIAGLNCALFSALGMPVRYWDISMHTVMDVQLDGKYAMIDNSMTALYTLCDGKTLAAVDEIGEDGACAASEGKVETGHIARYHCLNATSPNGFLTSADNMRSMVSEAGCFDPAYLKYRYYFNDWDLGHRYILNVRDGEVYDRFYHRLDADSPNAVAQRKDDAKFRADPAYFTPNPQGSPNGKDPESKNPRYRIRGNGVRTYAPDLSATALAKHAWALEGVKATDAGVAPTAAGKAGSVTFRVEGANVITSLKIQAEMARKSANDQAAVAISTDNGMNWKAVGEAVPADSAPIDLKLISEVNGAYEVLVKVSLLGQQAAADAALKAIRFETITQLNSKTLPRLRLGKNTVYVGAGAPEQSVVLWPDLRGDGWKSQVVDSTNVATYRDPEKQGEANHPGYRAVMFAQKPKAEAYVVFKLDVPGDLSGLTYGGRFFNRAQSGQVDLLHSFDGGKTWTNTYTLTDISSPWDVIHYEQARAVPPGVRSALVKYRWNASTAGAGSCGLYAVRMEANFTPADAAFKPLDVAFTWNEVQQDYTTVTRSHVQRVDKVPCTYTVNVGGEDHPVMESLRVNRVGAPGGEAPATCGYSDGKDVGGTKWMDRWVSVGKVLSTGKSYTTTEPSGSQWGAGDPDGKILTDGVVGSTYVSGSAYTFGVLYAEKTKPEVTVDLGKPESCGAFRIHVGGYPGWDALKGKIKDQIEVLTSLDGQAFTSRGFFDLNLRWKDIPANFKVPDEETLCGYNAPLILREPVQARYVQYRITPARQLSITEVQVLDGITYAPFDLKIALPDGRDRSNIAAYPLRHDPSQKYERRVANQ